MTKKQKIFRKDPRFVGVILFVALIMVTFSATLVLSEPLVFPTLQKVKWNGSYSADKTFAVNAEGSVPVSTINEYRNFLKQWGFAEAENGIVFNIKMIDADECMKVYKKPYQRKIFQEYSEYQTYFLDVADGSVTVKACGIDGFFYGLMTFKQIYEDKGEQVLVNKAEIVDYPAYPVRGLFEGAYGVWDLEGRLDVLDWMGEVKLNSFLYGPKGDPMIRRRWRRLYDDTEMFNFKRMIEKARVNHINFGYVIAPTFDMEYSSEEDFNTLKKKCRQMQSLGVKYFLIAFDDTMGMVHHESDRKKFSDLGAAEAYIANKLFKELKAYDSDVLMAFCPEIYSGVWPMDYTNSLVEKLDPEIYIGWTGTEIVAPKVESGDVKKFTEFYKRSPSFGDNWGTLYPLVARGTDMYGYMTQFMMNPYNLFGELPGSTIQGASEPELMPIEGAGLAQLSWNSDVYDSEQTLDMMAKIYFEEEAKSVFKALVYKDYYDFNSYADIKTEFKPPIEKEIIEAGTDAAALKAYVSKTVTGLKEILEKGFGMMIDKSVEPKMGLAFSKRISSSREYYEDLIKLLGDLDVAVDKGDEKEISIAVEKYLKVLRRKS